MGNLVDFFPLGLDAVDIALEKIAGRKRHEPLVAHAFAAADRIRRRNRTLALF